MIPAMLQRDTATMAPTPADIDPDQPADPYRKLWCSVLIQAVADLQHPTDVYHLHKKAEMRAARRWFESKARHVGSFL